MIFDMPVWLHFLLAIPVAMFGVGRLSRVVVYDDFPASIKLRIWWGRITSRENGEDGPWTKLLNCFWCFTPWLTLVAMIWFALGTQFDWVAWTWWLFWGWLGLSYLTSMLIARDEPA
jgi:hypothetical protein